MNEIIIALTSLCAVVIGLVAILILAYIVFTGRIGGSRFRSEQTEGKHLDLPWKKVVGRVLLNVGKELVRPAPSRTLGISSKGENDVVKKQ